MDEDRFEAFTAGATTLVVCVVTGPMSNNWILAVLGPLLVALGTSWSGYRVLKWLRRKGWR